MKMEIEDLVIALKEKEQLDQLRHEELLKAILELKEPLKVKAVTQRMQDAGAKTIQQVQRENQSLREKLLQRKKPETINREEYDEQQDQDIVSEAESVQL